jgi:hypothetical protein
MPLSDAITDPDLTITLGLAAPAHRIPIGAGHDLVHLGGQPTPGHRGPAQHAGRQPGIHGGQHLGIGDQIRAIHQRLKHPVIDVPAAKHPGHPRQPLAHGQRIAQVAARHRQADPKRRGHLGAHRRPGIHRPIGLLTALGAAQLEQLPDGIQPIRRRPRLDPPRPTHPLHQRPRPLAPRGIPIIVKPSIEHTFEHSSAR